MKTHGRKLVWHKVSTPPLERGNYLCVKAGYLPYSAMYRPESGFILDDESVSPTHWAFLDDLNLPNIEPIITKSDGTIYR